MTEGAIAIAALAAAAATATLAEVAARTRFVDDPAGAPERKLQPGAVPAVGGAAVLVGLLAASAAQGSLVPAAGVWPALLAAFALGLVDDRKRGGLPPVALLVGQTATAAVLVACGWRLFGAEGPLAIAASLVAVVVAMNCVNTFDNADGAATLVGILGLSARSPLVAAPLFGFLPFNLWLRRGRAADGARSADPEALRDENAHPGARSAPVAYLGNSGSHLLGVLLAVDPIGRCALLVPFLDLVRVAFERAVAGGPPWKGDRRHLAHRVQRAGFSPSAVALLLAVIAAPAVIGAGMAQAVEPSQRTLSATAGAALTAVFYAIAVARSPRSQ